MRLAPIVLHFMPERESVLHFAGESSRTTHGTLEAVNGCRVLAGILAELLDGSPKDEALAGAKSLDGLGPGLTGIVERSYLTKTEAEIRGSGYVVASLEAALWCFARADSFEDAVLLAANLGDDADTTAAVCGQIAGAYWGEAGIPDRWLQRLHLADEIRERADKLAAAT
jgi:ADP-ribosyl-[dinitrogen reductase] hydrolase